MISKATSSDSWTAEDLAAAAEAIVRDQVANAQTPEANGTQNIELNSAEGWTEFMREIVAMANRGGGRIVVRCVAGDESANSPGRVFSVPIASSVEKEPATSKLETKSPAAANLKPVRIVTDPDAPALQPQDVDHLYPWRQKDLLRELNSRLGRRFLNSYDIQAVRRQHRLDERPDFVFNLPGAGRRYSPAVAEWMMDQHNRDPEFFHRARTADHEIMKLRRRKPR